MSEVEERECPRCRGIARKVSHTSRTFMCFQCQMEWVPQGEGYRMSYRIPGRTGWDLVRVPVGCMWVSDFLGSV